MHRRLLALPSLLVAAAIAVGACGPTTPALSDPGEILVKAVEALEGAKTVHLEAAIDGTVSLDLMGTGQGGDLALTGTKLVADLDLEEGDTAFELAVPAMLGLTVEAISIGADTWTRISLVSPKFQKGTTSDTGLPIDPGDPDSMVEGLKTWLEDPTVDPEKLDDTGCGSKTCYQVRIELAADDLLALVPDVIEAGSGTVLLTVLVEKDSLRPAGFNIEVTAEGLGQLQIELSTSKWDESLDIEPPPADEVE